MHDTMIHADSGDYTWTSPQDALDGNGPQPEPPLVRAYTMCGEAITCNPAPTRPYGAGADLRTFPQRVEQELADLRAGAAVMRAEIDELRADYATLRAIVVELADVATAIAWRDSAPVTIHYPEAQPCP